jgi:hypothetical protein
LGGAPITGASTSVEPVGSRRAHLDEALAARAGERAGGATERCAEGVGAREARDDDVDHLDGLRRRRHDDAGTDVHGA